MLTDNYKKSCLKIQNIYFSNGIVQSSADITRYSQCKISNDQCVEFNTNIVDLALDVKEIEQGFRKNIRNEISQAKAKHNILVNFFYKPTIEEINSFCLFYDNTATKKEIPSADKDKINRLKKNVIISRALNNKGVLVWHLYIFDKERVRLLYSCSLATCNKELYKEISKANKLLHSEDIKFVKNKGFKVLDFGGLFLINNSDRVSGIDAFKLGFSKNIEKSYNFLVANTWMGKVALFFYSLKYIKIMRNK